MSQSIDFTVAIPTYNGETRLPDVLDKLRSQLNTDGISWEVIVIDNNSSDRTKQIVESYQATWDFSYPLRYCFEGRQGAGFARQTAMKEAKGKFVGFLDDDNVPALNWVQAAYCFTQQYPNIGAIASRIRAEYEIPPPANFERLQPFLAINERGDFPVLYDRSSRLLPPSAGLVIRKEAWFACVPEHCILNGRTPGIMLTSEDLEILSYIHQSEWEIWYNPDMKIIHKIPCWRLEKQYLISLIRGIGLSRYVTRTIGVNPWLKPFLWLVHSVNDIRRILQHLFIHGIAVKTDLIAACEMELFLSSLASPFYLWKKGYFNQIK